MKSSSRQNPQIDNFREYSVELGLRTHRPSGFSQNFLPANDSSRSSHKYPAHQSNGHLSTCSNTPQCGELGDWWDLPSSSSAANYEQRTKTVRVSYSLDEIYGRAKVPFSEKLTKQSQYEKDKGENQITFRLPSPRNLNPSHLENISSYKEGQNHTSRNRRYANLKDRLDDQKHYQSDFSFDHAATGSAMFSERFDNNVTSLPERPTTSYTNDFPLADSHTPAKHQPLNAWDSNNNNKGSVLSGVQFRTFEEAMGMYPSDDEDSSEDLPSAKHYAHFKPPQKESVPRESVRPRGNLDTMIKPSISPPSYESSMQNVILEVSPAISSQADERLATLQAEEVRLLFHQYILILSVMVVAEVT